MYKNNLYFYMSIHIVFTYEIDRRGYLKTKIFENTQVKVDKTQKNDEIT